MTKNLALRKNEDAGRKLRAQAPRKWRDEPDPAVFMTAAVAWWRTLEVRVSEEPRWQGQRKYDPSFYPATTGFDVRDLSAQPIHFEPNTTLGVEAPEDLAVAFKQHVSAAEGNPERLEQLWALIDDCVDLLEAKMRLLMVERRQAAPESPNWVTESVESVNATDSAKKSARNLLSCLAKEAIVKEDDAEVEDAANGCVRVSLNSGVAWLVSPPKLPWPAVNVRLYLPEGEDTPRLRVHSCHLASTVLKLTAREHHVAGFFDDGR